MKKRSASLSLWIALLVSFIDYMGVGLVYPMFSSMLFDPSSSLLPAGISDATRGIWLGVLIAMLPFAQFFGSPIWGALSDGKGRKQPLLWSLVVALFGYLIALVGVLGSSLLLLLFSRLVIGFGSGNMAIVQATVADISSPERKGKNFALYSMSLGAGFTLGPFLGGILSGWGFGVPFIFAAAIIALNWGFVLLFFKETHRKPVKTKMNWAQGFIHLKKAFHLTGIRVILLCTFLHCFVWSYFFEFVPVYFIDKYQFSSTDLGLFFGASGGFYALSTGLLIRPFIGRFKPELLFFCGNFFAGLAVLALLGIPSVHWLWPVTFLVQFCVAFVWPNATTMISNSASPEIQGEALGVFASVNALALILSPLFSGSAVGHHPSLPMWVGGLGMVGIALLGVSVFRKKLFKA